MVPQPDLQLTSAVGGFVVTRSGEMLSPGEFLYMKNTRSLTPTTIQTRNGYLKLNPIALPDLDVHTIRRLNDYTIDQSRYIVGAGDTVYAGETAYTAMISGFSSLPMTMVPSSGFQSPAPWMYIGDVTRMAKVGTPPGAAIVGYNMGIEASDDPASFIMNGQPFKVIDNFDALTGWAASAGVMTDVNRVNTTIGFIIYNQGATTGYASVVPAAFTQEIQPRMLLDVGGEVIQVHSVYAPIASTTIADIRYETGTTGFCDIVLALPSDELVQDTLLHLNNGQPNAEVVPVLAIVEGPDGSKSVKTVTGNVHAAGETVAGFASFRAWFAGTHGFGEAITTDALQLAIPGSGLTTLTKTAALDLSNIGARPVLPNDDIHISFRVADQSLITEIQILLDVDRSVNDFTRNYYYAAISANDLAPNAAQNLTLLSTQQRAIQRDLIRGFYNDKPFGVTADGQVFGTEDLPFFNRAAIEKLAAEVRDGAGSQESLEPQAALGDVQWSEIVVKVSDLIRVGTDDSRSLRDVQAIRVSFNTTAAVTILSDAWYIGGTFGPDEGPAQIGYLYAYQYRSQKAGGARSNLSPTPRALAKPHRESVLVSGDKSADPQVDTVDIYRLGGTISTWQYIGSTSNAGIGPWTFLDVFGDEFVATNLQAQENLYQPFPTSDLPRRGVVDVVGTLVNYTSGDNFNTRWGRGSAILINGTPTRLYASPTSTTRLEIADNLGDLAGATFEIPNALLLATPMQVLIGPYTNGGPEHIFAVGDGSGNVYWTNPNDPDSASDANFLTVTSASEPLITGCMYDGKVFLFSTERMFFLLSDGQGGFVAQEVANSKGCFAATSICVGQLIYFLAKDGIYESEGGQPRLISGPLYPLFPHETANNATDFSTSIPAIRFDDPNRLRLATYGNYLYFSYDPVLPSTIRKTLVWDIRRRCWISDDVYANPAYVHYGAEGFSTHALLFGSNDGFIYQFFTNIDDNGVPIAGQILTGSKYYEWWRHIRSFNIEYISQDPHTFTIIVDGVSFPHVMPSSPVLTNPYRAFTALQGKNFQYQLDFDKNFKLFTKDTALEMKAWPHSGAYLKNLIFG